MPHTWKFNKGWLFVPNCIDRFEVDESNHDCETFNISRMMAIVMLIVMVMMMTMMRRWWWWRQHFHKDYNFRRTLDYIRSKWLEITALKEYIVKQRLMLELDVKVVLNNKIKLCIFQIVNTCHSTPKKPHAYQKVNIIKSQNIYYPSTKQYFYYQTILGKKTHTHIFRILK